VQMKRHSDGGRLQVHFQSKCTGVDLNARTVSFEHDGAATQEDYDLLVRAGVQCIAYLCPHQGCDDSEAWFGDVAMKKRCKPTGDLDVSKSGFYRPTLGQHGEKSSYTTMQAS
jgi:hypothetical protein